MRFAIDLDGVITANPSAMSWLTYHLCKNENKHEVYIITWRNGGDVERKNETIRDLEKMGIYYHKLIMADTKIPNMRVACFWKVQQMRENKINIWMDDDIKIYKRDYGIDVNKLLPDVQTIYI
jgi:hypothetical protein